MSCSDYGWWLGAMFDSLQKQSLWEGECVSLHVSFRFFCHGKTVLSVHKHFHLNDTVTGTTISQKEEFEDQRNQPFDNKLQTYPTLLPSLNPRKSLRHLFSQMSGSTFWEIHFLAFCQWARWKDRYQSRVCAFSTEPESGDGKFSST